MAKVTSVTSKMQMQINEIIIHMKSHVSLVLNGADILIKPSFLVEMKQRLLYGN